MLLDRQRTKFWQRIVFGGMAFLMVAWLVSMGVSQVMCGGKSGAGNVYDDRIDATVAEAKANPKSPEALFSVAMAYQDRASVETEGSVEQRDDLTQALAYFERYIGLKDKVLGADAAQRRADAYLAMAVIHSRLGDAKSVVSDYAALTDLDPKDSDNFLQLGRAAQDAGDNRMAYLAFARYLELDPTSELAPLVRDELKRIKKLLTAASKPTPTPAPSGTR